MYVCTDCIAPGGQTGVVSAVPHPRPGHQQLGQGPGAGLLRLQADPAAGGIEIQNLKKRKVLRNDLSHIIQGVFLDSPSFTIYPAQGY